MESDNIITHYFPTPYGCWALIRADEPLVPRLIPLQMPIEPMHHRLCVYPSPLAPVATQMARLQNSLENGKGGVLSHDSIVLLVRDLWVVWLSAIDEEQRHARLGHVLAIGA